MTLEEATARITHAGWSALDSVFGELGDATPPELVLRAVLPALENHGTMLLQTLRAAPLSSIEALLIAFEQRHDFVSTFARVACANIGLQDELVTAWKRAFTIAIDADQDFPSLAERQRLITEARDPQLLSALIAGMGVSTRVPKLVFAMVLASKDESAVDGLLPHLERAQRDDELLDCLWESLPHEDPIPAFEPVNDRLNELLERRAERSTLAQELKRNGVTTMRWQMMLSLGRGSRRLELTFDTTDYPTLATHGLKELYRQHQTAPASAADIPRWLLEVSAKLSWPGRLRGTLRGEERAAFERWLESGRR